jgi:hypothetical protein
MFGITATFGVSAADPTPNVAAHASDKVKLIPQSDRNSFDFETDQVAGTIRLDGAYHGVSRLMDKRTGRQLIHPKLSALNLYRLMAVNHVLGMPRTMPRTVAADATWAEARWTAGEAKDEVAARLQVGELTARYEVTAPATIDMTLTVRSQGTFAGFEVFAPNYLDKSLRPHLYLQPRTFSGQTAKEPERVRPTVNDVFRDTLLVFPRDAHAARRCIDGRWDRREIQACPVRHYGHCLAVMADPDDKLAVLLMAQPRHCFAISARYDADNDADRLTPYSAVDFSLFGDDLLPGDVRSVRVRLMLTPLDDWSKPLAIYRSFLGETDGHLPAPNKPDTKGASP